MTTADELTPGEHVKLVIDVRKAMNEKIEPGDQDFIVRRFGIEVHEDDFRGYDWNDILVNANEANLIEFAEFLEVAVPRRSGLTVEVDAVLPSVDAYAELVAAETALRAAIRLGVPNWVNDLTPEEVAKLEAKRTEEAKRRDGVTVSQDLLDYSEVYLLQKFIKTRWADLKPILDDEERIKVYLGIILDIRNTVSHSRPITPAERLLLAGASGQIRNQIATFRNGEDAAKNHYSSIDSARDGFGTDGLESLASAGSRPTIAHRLEVGDQITFEVSGSDPRGRELSWTLFVIVGGLANMFTTKPSRETASGATTQLIWDVGTSDVGEHVALVIALRNSSPYQRMGGSDYDPRSTGYDDVRAFHYAVNPPTD